MVMLSDLQRYVIVDSSGEKAGLTDLAVDLSDGAYPPVTHLLVRGPQGPSCLPWGAVREIDWHRGSIVVDDLHAAETLTAELLEQAILLSRDVNDTLLLDLENCQATRANDLWLLEENGQLCLRAADISPWAVIRRLGHGLLGRGADRNLLDWKTVEFLSGDPSAVRPSRYHCRVANRSATEIARLADAIPYLHAAELLALLPEDLAADVLEAMNLERQIQVFDELNVEHALRILALMAPDAAADLLGRLPPEHAAEFIDKLPGLQRTRVVALLRYPEDSAGGIMTNDVVVAPSGVTMRNAREAISDQLESPDFVYYVYVVDDEERSTLLGVLTLREFVMSNDDRLVDDVMNIELRTIDALQSAGEAARRLAENGFMALPVVGSDGRLLGAVTVDAAMAQIAPPSLRGQAPRVFS
jgi:magnesium transporter